MYGKSRRIKAYKGQYGPVRSAHCFVCSGPIGLKISQGLDTEDKEPMFYCETEKVFLSDSGAFLLLGDRPNVA